MNASLRALLAEAIDYAGTFPPASLTLEQATENYFRYRESPEAWMLGRYVCPADRLQDLAAIVERTPAFAGKNESGGAGGISIAAVLPAVATSAQWRTSLATRLDAIRGSRLATSVHSIEVRLPDELTRATTYGELRGMLEPLLDELAVRLPATVAAFVESPAAPAVESPAQAKCDDLNCWVAKCLAGYFQPKNSPGSRIAFKLRTGGATVQQVLSSAELARTICVLREHSVCWKATAGLHQPMYHYDVKLGTYSPGFVNVLAAAVLVDLHHLPEMEVQSILEDENVSSFEFGEQALRWRSRSATVEQISLARRRSLLSFGSCSFDEPVGGLRSLGWL